MTGSPDQINDLLEEGYEVSDILPIHQTSGGAMFSRTRGNYVLKVLILLTPSDRRTTLDIQLITLKNGYMTGFNELLDSQNKLGYKARWILPLDVHLDPEAHAGIGKGTYGFGVFFVKVLNEEREGMDESDPVNSSSVLF